MTVLTPNTQLAAGVLKAGSVTLQNEIAALASTSQVDNEAERKFPTDIDPRDTPDKLGGSRARRQRPRTRFKQKPEHKRVPSRRACAIQKRQKGKTAGWRREPRHSGTIAMLGGLGFFKPPSCYCGRT
jgi:hypothetical protein